MNLRSRTVNLSARVGCPPRQSHFAKVIFGQNHPACLEWEKPFMSLLSFTRRTAVGFCRALVLVLPAAVLGQTNYYNTNGTEYAIIGSRRATRFGTMRR